MSVLGILMAMMAGAPVLVSAASRKTHTGVGDFDLALSLTPSAPTIDPRTFGTQLIVLTFDRSVSSGNATVTEGTATVGTITFSGNEMRIPLTSVSDIQYITVSATGVNGAGVGSVRMGVLYCDVNQSGGTSLTDKTAINSKLSQSISTGNNYLYDVNCSGAITASDETIANANLSHNLPAP